MKTYNFLKNKYPEQISLNQLYQICKVAKCTARYLLTSGIIPCVENTENRTWRYKIALDDVIVYLQKRDKNGSLIPKGAIKKKKYKTKKEISVPPSILSSDKKEAKDYFAYIYKDCSDILTVPDIATMTGLCAKSIRGLIKNGNLNAVYFEKVYVVPKEYLMKFVVSKKYLQFRSYSDSYKKVLNGFDLWRAAKN